jgi:hypothetical protein
LALKTVPFFAVAAMLFVLFVRLKGSPSLQRMLAVNGFSGAI